MFSGLGPFHVYATGIYVAPGGATLEFHSKKINHGKYPFVRTVVEIFSKTIQTISYVVPFYMLGRSVQDPLRSAIYYTISAVALIPTVNGIVQYYGNNTWKKRLSDADRVLSGISKVFNTAVLTNWAYAKGGLLGAVVVGGTVGTMCWLAFDKK